MTETFYSRTLPILALRGLTVFPGQTVHFDVGRPKSVVALEAAMKQDQYILLIPQKDLLVDAPKLSDLYSIGVIEQVKQVLKGQGRLTFALSQVGSVAVKGFENRDHRRCLDYGV